MKNIDLHRNIVAQSTGTSQTTSLPQGIRLLGQLFPALARPPRPTREKVAAEGASRRSGILCLFILVRVTVAPAASGWYANLCGLVQATNPRTVSPASQSLQTGQFEPRNDLELKKIPLHFYAAHDIIKKVSPETRLAIHRIEAVSVVFPLPLVYLGYI